MIERLGGHLAPTWGSRQWQFCIKHAIAIVVIQWQAPVQVMEFVGSLSGSQTLVSCVTGRDTHHYTPYILTLSSSSLLFLHSLESYKETLFTVNTAPSLPKGQIPIPLN